MPTLPPTPRCVHGTEKVPSHPPTFADCSLPAHGFAGQSLWSLRFPDSPLTNEDCSQTSLSAPRLTNHLAHLLSVERSGIEQLESGAENSSEPRIPRAGSPDTEHGARTKMCPVKLRRDSGFWGVGCATRSSIIPAFSNGLK